MQVITNRLPSKKEKKENLPKDSRLVRHSFDFLILCTPWEVES